MSKMFDYERCD